MEIGISDIQVGPMETQEPHLAPKEGLHTKAHLGTGWPIAVTLSGLGST